MSGYNYFIRRTAHRCPTKENCRGFWAAIRNGNPKTWTVSIIPLLMECQVITTLPEEQPITTAPLKLI